MWHLPYFWGAYIQGALIFGILRYVKKSKFSTRMFQKGLLANKIRHFNEANPVANGRIRRCNIQF